MMKCVDVPVGAVGGVCYTHHSFSIDVDRTDMQAAAHCDKIQQHCPDEASKQLVGQQDETPVVMTVSRQVSPVTLLGIV